jgi:hypothetical protein
MTRPVPEAPGIPSHKPDQPRFQITNTNAEPIQIIEIIKIGEILRPNGRLTHDRQGTQKCEGVQFAPEQKAYQMYVQPSGCTPCNGPKLSLLMHSRSPTQTPAVAPLSRPGLPQRRLWPCRSQWDRSRNNQKEKKNPEFRFQFKLQMRRNRGWGPSPDKISRFRARQRACNAPFASWSRRRICMENVTLLGVRDRRLCSGVEFHMQV